MTSVVASLKTFNTKTCITVSRQAQLVSGLEVEVNNNPVDGKLLTLLGTYTTQKDDK